MPNSECSKSPSRPTGSRTRLQTRCADSTDPQSSSSTAPAVSSTSAMNYATLDPFTLMNTPNNAFFAGQLPNSPHTVNASVMHDNNLCRSSPTTQPLPPQYQPHLMMWPFIPQQSVTSNVPLSGGHSGLVNSQPPGHPPYPPILSAVSRSTLQRTSPVPSHSQIHSPISSGQEQSPVDPEEATVLEDKRRRNTAASARFRIKKKQKNLNLQRTVSDLTSRAEELEREATNLRRENNWLKEMVIMKGRRNMSGSQCPLEEASSDSRGNNRDTELAEYSDIDHLGLKRSGKGKMKGKHKARAGDGGNGKSKRKGK